jgi:hypothetical protein
MTIDLKLATVAHVVSLLVCTELRLKTISTGPDLFGSAYQSDLDVSLSSICIIVAGPNTVLNFQHSAIFAFVYYSELLPCFSSLAYSSQCLTDSS